MALNESTPVTVHQHTGGTSTFSNYPYGVSLSSDQAADEVLGTAVLSNGAEVVVTATVGLVALPPNYNAKDTAAYTSVQVTTIDNGVATTNTLSFAAGSDFLDRSFTSENLQVIGLTNGNYVIAETTVNDNIGVAENAFNQNLYFEVLSNSGSVVTPWTQVNASGSDAQYNDNYQLRATSDGGFVVQWGTNNGANAYFQRFTASGAPNATNGSAVNYNNTSSGSALSSGFAVDTAGDVAVSIQSASGSVYAPGSIAIYNSSNTQLINESWATAESGLVPEQTATDTLSGGSGIPVNTNDGLQFFAALPGGGFLTVVTDPNGPYSTPNANFPGFNEYLQRITVSGSTVTFDTPILIEKTTTAAQSGDLNLAPIVLSNGNILVKINGTYEMISASELPSSNTGMASSSVVSMTPAFNGSPLPTGTTMVDPISDNHGGIFTALQTSTNGGPYYGKLDSSVYAADFNANNPCYCRGTLIRTKRGHKKVEKLKIGDQIMTMSGVARPIKWIGRRSYAGQFVTGRKDVLPVCIKAGALDENVPRRDLWISPNHAMYLDGVLIEARHLVNGLSVVQAREVEKIEYFHIELDSHDVIIAEGALSETYFDDDNRALFHNAHEFAALYPKRVAGPGGYCAQRLDEGYQVEAVRRRVALRAGLLRAAEGAPLGKLLGYVESVTAECVSGWAQNADHPEGPVCLDIFAAGQLIGQVVTDHALANDGHEDLGPEDLTQDLAQANLDFGWHRFAFAVPAGSNIDPHVVEVRRSVDGAILVLPSEERRAELRQMARDQASRPAIAGHGHPKTFVHRRIARR